MGERATMTSVEMIEYAMVKPKLRVREREIGGEVKLGVEGGVFLVDTKTVVRSV